MGYDEPLAERIRDALSDTPGVSERKMFGGIAFMVHGNMAVGVSNSDLMVRVGEAADSLLDGDGVRPFDLSGKKMKGWLLVEASATAADNDLAHWVGIGLDIAESLPAK